MDLYKRLRELDQPLSGESKPFPAWRVNPIPMDIVDGMNTIWRYTTVPHLLNSLRKTERDGYYNLHFTRTSWFDVQDDYEGTVPSKIIENDRENLERHHTRGDFEIDADDHLKKKYGNLLDGIEDDEIEGGMERMRDLTYINCWIIKEYESNPMWHAYTNEKTGIAIKTTVDELLDSIHEWDERLFYGAVRYIDFSNFKFPVSPIQHYFLKRREFEEESEFRLATTFKQTSAMTFPTNAEVMASAPENDRVEVAADLNSMADAIITHPHSDDYFIDMIKDTIGMFGVDPELVRDSSLRVE